MHERFRRGELYVRQALSLIAHTRVSFDRASAQGTSAHRTVFFSATLHRTRPNRADVGIYATNGCIFVSLRLEGKALRSGGGCLEVKIAYRSSTQRNSKDARFRGHLVREAPLTYRGGPPR